VLDVGDASAFISAFGFSGGSGPTSQQLVHALVSWFNGHGGIAGKQIKLVEYTADVTASSYETEMSAACARFTQDSRVAVVLSNTGYQTSENYETCLTRAGVPSLNNSVGGLDDSTLAKHPLLLQTSAASVDSSLRALLKGLTANGFLTSKNRIGVLVEACPSNVTAYQRTLAPLAKQLGLDVQRRDFDCVTGAGTMPQAIGQINASVLPFATAGVDRVLFVSNYQGAGAVFFEKQAASQGYAPSYGLTSYSGAGPSASEIGEDAQKRIKGVGWSPDLDNGRRPPVTGARKRCRDAYASQQLDLGSGTAYVTADALCGAFFALEAALQRSHGRTDAASLGAGLETASANPFVLGDSLVFAAGRHHAGRLFAPYALSPACGCFAYTGKPFLL
jgi:ABC-type branched-subunit amino acid transport system substrate-binding protein